ncbi:HDOD domain-containing protein [Rhodoferax sp. GW822-FHT02A01]|uniref:HDOD domain-containing protein n=1 Tax=Rhodoferax sp. GW822-FHT02A01 TaxID=3141537 RepID=UPI00315D0043
MIQSDQDIRNRLLVAKLPAMPQILLKLLGLCQADGAGMAEMAKLVANDPGMTVKVLNVANSAAYNRGGQKVGLMQALSTLGSDMIKTLVISESVLQTFNSFPYSANSDLRVFWKHALTTAVIARELARAMDYAHGEEAYLAGLLHDVGRMALLAAAPDDYTSIFYSPDNETLCALEQRSLQISHVEAGAWLIERWNLDSYMADAVLYHHEPASRVEGAHPLIRIVHLAHALASHDAALPLAEDAGYLCKISGENLLAITQGAAGQVEKAAAYLGIDLSGLEAWTPPQTLGAPAANPIQQRMNEEIQHMALAAEVGQSLARQKDDNQLLKVIRQNAQILYDLDNTIILLMSGNAQSLVGVSVADHLQRLSEFSVMLSAGGGIAQCALQNRVAFLSRKDGLLNLNEEQLLRTFDADGLVCIPLTSGARCLGVLVGGVPARLMPDLKRRERFLQAFGVQAATALNVVNSDRSEIDRRITAIKEEHRESARRVLHEVNNPLSIIKNYLGVLDDKLTRHEPVEGELSVLNEEIDRVGNIMNEFVGAAPVVAPGKVNLNHVVGNVVRLFRESKFLPPSVEILSQLSERDCEIEGPADTIKQILVNLIKNAVEAMPKGGRIEIALGGPVQRDGRPYYTLCVKDNGPGIPPQLRSRLFSPVQSTKAGTNRGIGLSIVHGLVKKLGGRIECQSSAMGTAFEMELPVPVTASARSGAGMPFLQDRV